MLTLTEELFLISLREKKDTVGLPYSAALPYALGGAMLGELVARGILKEEEKKFLWVIPTLEYSQKDASGKYQRKQHLHAIVLGGQTPDQQSAAMTAALSATGALGI